MRGWETAQEIAAGTLAAVFAQRARAEATGPAMPVVLVVLRLMLSSVHVARVGEAS